MAGSLGVPIAIACSLAAILNAGCVDSDGDSGTPAASDGPPFAGLAYPCLDSMTRYGDLCVGFVGDGERLYGEPTVAVHPLDGQIAAIASIVAPATPGVPVAPGMAVDVVDIDVHFTQDGGDTWTTSTLPLERILANHPAGGKQIGQNVDPAMAFDATGVLHFSGLVVPILGGNVPDVYYTSSPDLGASWTDPQFLTSNGKADRNWLSVMPDGVVYVAWARGPESATAAWSEDGGATWTEIPEEGVPCYWFLTAPVSQADRELSACTGDTPDGSVVRLYAFDRVYENASMVAEIPGPLGRPYLSPHGDGLLLAVDSPQQTVLYRSGNETDEWTDPADPRQLLDAAEGWTWLRNRWTTTDPWGNVHLLFEGDSACTTNCDGMAGEVVHLVLDARLTKIEERLLTPSTPDMPQDLLEAPPADDYHGIAFGPDTGYLAWSWDGRIGWAKIVAATNGSDGI